MFMDLGEEWTLTPWGKTVVKRLAKLSRLVSPLPLEQAAKNNVKVTIFTKDISKQLLLDLNKYNSQYLPIELKEFKRSHDRFLIIDNKEVYHFGASLKDLGKKWFAFSKFDKEALKILDKLK